MPILLAKTDLVGVLMWIGVLIAAIVVLTLVIKWVRDKYQAADNDRVTASGILDGLRAMRDRGEMSEAEFETIRRQMAEKVRHDMKSAANATATPSGPPVGPYGLDPAVAAKLGMKLPKAKAETIVPPRLPEVDLSGPVKSSYVPQPTSAIRVPAKPRPAAPPSAPPPAARPPANSEPIPLAPPRPPTPPARSPIISPLQSPKPSKPPTPPPSPPPTSG